MRGFITTTPQDANELGTAKEQKGLWGKSALEFEPSSGDACLESSPVCAECWHVQHQPGGQGARKRDRRGLCGVGKVLERNEKLLEGLKQRTILRFTFYLS